VSQATSLPVPWRIDLIQLLYRFPGVLQGCGIKQWCRSCWRDLREEKQGDKNISKQDIERRKNDIGWSKNPLVLLTFHSLQTSLACINSFNHLYNTYVNLLFLSLFCRHRNWGSEMSKLHGYKGIIHIFLILCPILFLSELEIEFRTTLARWVLYTWETPPVLFALVIFFGRVLHFFDQAGLDSDPSTCAFHVAHGWQAHTPHDWLDGWDGISLTFFLGFPQTTVLLICTSKVTGITGVSHRAWPYVQYFFHLDHLLTGLVYRARNLIWMPWTKRFLI
jgi:hypothetical protein